MNSIRMRFPGGLARAFTMSYDDGVEQDERLISIMRAHGVKGTFNLNSGCFAADGTVYPQGQVHRRMTLAHCKECYAGDDIEVAAHSYTHPFLDRLPAGLRTLEIVRDREALEREFHTFVRGAAYPYGTYNAETIDTLRSCGIVYCRTVNSTHSFRIPENWLALDPTCHHNDPALADLADRFLTSATDRDPLLFYLWGHAYEFEQHDNWQVIEDFLARVGGRSDIWYATNIRIHDYVHAYGELIFACSGQAVYNPTATDLWLTAGSSESVCIPAGKTVHLR